MKKIGLVLTVLCIGTLYGCATGNGNQLQSVQGTELRRNLNLQGGSAWGGIDVVVQGNSVRFNGTAEISGYTSTNLSPNLGNRTVLLEILNAEASVFSEGRLFKITVNHNDQEVIPLNTSSLIFGEYVPSAYELVEFELPPDFDGKLGFVFYQAELNGLIISAWYR